MLPALPVSELGTEHPMSSEGGTLSPAAGKLAQETYFMLHTSFQV